MICPFIVALTSSSRIYVMKDLQEHLKCNTNGEFCVNNPFAEHDPDHENGGLTKLANMAEYKVAADAHICGVRYVTSERKAHSSPLNLLLKVDRLQKECGTVQNVVTTIGFGKPAVIPNQPAPARSDSFT